MCKTEAYADIFLCMQQIVVENAQGQPESGQVVQLQMDGKVLQNLTSDENGKAQYEVDTSTLTTSNVNFQVSGYCTVQPL